MPRKKREEFPGAVLHVWTRRVERSRLFVDADDYRRYIALLGATVTERDWLLLSFCLMPNHIHLLVELRVANFSHGIRDLHRRYVRSFNDRHHRSGRLFEHRPGTRLVADDLYFVTAVRYIEMNPVAAGLCTRPEGWPWSSRGMAARRCPAWLADEELTKRRI